MELKKYLFLFGIFIITQTVLFSKTNCKIIVRKFNNTSEYKGHWRIGSKFAELIHRELVFFHGYNNVIFTKNLYSDVNYTNVIEISGEIRKFKFREHIIAAYKIGGYKNYNVKIEVSIKIKFPGIKK